MLQYFLLQKVPARIIASPYKGALTQLYAATSPEVETKRLRLATFFVILMNRNPSNETFEFY
jgi:hypothetical protein